MMLTINPDLSDSEAFGAIAAEIAHARFHDHGFNWAYSREAPDLSKLPELFRDRQVSVQLGVLNTIRDMMKRRRKGIGHSEAKDAGGLDAR